MKKFMLFLIAVIFVLSGISCYAQSFESYNISMHIAYNSVVVKERMAFDNPVSGNILFEIPEDNKGLSVMVDGKSTTPELNGGLLNLDLISASAIEINYVTRDLLEGNDFVMSFEALHNISNMHIKLVLPENAVLTKPISEAGMAGSSVYPKPSSAGTDGLSIILGWDFNDVQEDDELSFFVRYAKQASYTYLILLIVLIILIIGGFTAFILLKKPKIKEVEKIVEKIVEKPAEKIVEAKGGYEKHLKEDEEQIVNILKQREDQCEQGTLRIITGFSKAKLSGLLKELEDRKVIFKEKRGKKNRVFLKEQ